MQEGTTEFYLKRLNSLKAEFRPYVSKMLDIADFIGPEHGRFLRALNPQNNDGPDPYDEIINAIGTEALDVCVSGLINGLMDPTQPWFMFGLEDRDLMKWKPAKEWLQDYRNVHLDRYAKTNLYTSTYSYLKETILFGTSSMDRREDFETIMSFSPNQIGGYYLLTDNRNKVIGKYKEMKMTAYMLSKQFKEENLSRKVREAISSKKWDQQFDVVHIVEPNDHLQPSKNDFRGMKYISRWFLRNPDDNKDFLSVRGFRTKPFVSQRWDVVGMDTYGSGQPGIRAVGDSMQIQIQEKTKLKGMGKQADPPMQGPASAKQYGVQNFKEGGMSWTDDPNGFRVAQQVNIRLADLTNDIAKVEERVRRLFYNQLFVGISMIDKNMSAREVSARDAEKGVLAPITKRFNTETLTEIIEGAHDKFLEFDRLNPEHPIIPPPPKELEGHELKVEFISPLAQAQKRAGLEAIEQSIGFIGEAAKIYPSITDIVDSDEAGFDWLERRGVPPRVRRDKNEVIEIRTQRARKEQAAAAAEQTPALVDAASKLGNTPIDNNTVLDALIEGGAQ